MQDNIIKINLGSEFADGWHAFIEKCLNACINRNKETTNKYIYTMSYDYNKNYIIIIRRICK